MGDARRIDLASSDELRLGDLAVRPSLRTIVRDDGTEEVIEPRVMQVLVALAEARGAVVSRDAMVDQCWEGRVVGDDAINRVISRLRRLSRGIGANAFEIETVNKVGYRLVVPGETPPALAGFRPTRRQLLFAGGGAALLAGGGAGVWIATRSHDRRPPAAVATFVEQAQIAMRQKSQGAGNFAIANLRHAVEMRPDYADGWGALAWAYVYASQWRPSPFDKALKDRARAAADRARALDPENGLARAAMASTLPRSGNQFHVEREYRAAVEQHPENDLILGNLGGLMLSVGRCREAAALFDRAVAAAPAVPGTLYLRVQALWAAGRLQDAYRASDDAFTMYPTVLGVWFTRFYLLAHSGRPADALEQAKNRDARPRGVPEYGFDVVLAATRAMLTRKPEDVESAIRINWEASHRGCGYAENAMQYASGLGRIDTAFALANAYFFARGFSTGELRFLAEEKAYTPQNDRRTEYLFLPSSQAMRTDSRFDGVVEELQLKRYWREAGVVPDYLAKA